MFQKRRRDRRYQATFIDQGYCFHAGDWKFIDASLGGVFAENTVYRGVTGWPSFEPWLSRIENLVPETAFAIAEIIPPEWYGGDLSALEILVERLLARRVRVRELIMGFRVSARRPFPIAGCWSRALLCRCRLSFSSVLLPGGGGPGGPGAGPVGTTGGTGGTGGTKGTGGAGGAGG